MKKQPDIITLEELDRRKIAANDKYVYLSRQFSLVTSFHFSRMEGVLFVFGEPYRLREGRIIQVTKGSATVWINLVCYEVCMGDILLLPPGVVIEVTAFLPELDFRMVGFDPVLLQYTPARNSYLVHPEKCSGYFLRIEEKEKQLTDQFFSLLWDITCKEQVQYEIISSLLAGFLLYLGGCGQKERPVSGSSPYRQEETFRRFIALVHRHGCRERTVRFYATQLCLTPRYLNTVVRHASGYTVMDWIERAVITEAKILLRYSDIPIYQVTEKLHFPNPSFFSKFFKRLVGITPLEYRKGKR